MDIQTIMELSAVVKGQGLSAIEVDENGVRIRIENEGGIQAQPVQAAAPVTAPVSPVAQPAAAETAVEAAQFTEDSAQYTYVTAPMVGIFCSLEKMGKKPLAVGDAVTPETVVCGIEAMKMVCDVNAEESGSFAELLVNDGDQVEFGQQLIKLKKS